VKEAMGWFAVLALLTAAGCVQNTTRLPSTIERSRAAPESALAETYPLFTIERSINANVVHYDAQLTADGRLDTEEPVIAYHVMLAEDGRRKKLNWIEKKLAYGFDIRPDPAVGGYTMTMVAAPQRPITVKGERNAVRAEAVIDGHSAVLRKMYVDASDASLWPQIRYVDLYGEDLQTGEDRFERMMPK
jgi:hypothetical protein